MQLARDGVRSVRKRGRSALRRVRLVLNMILMRRPPAASRAHPHRPHVSTPHSTIRLLSTAPPIPAQNSLARASHARRAANPEGDTEDGGRLPRAPGGIKSLSTSSRRGTRRPAADELAHPQQALLKLHEEAWAGLLQNQGLGTSQEVEVVRCAVSVACPSCPDNSPV